MRQQSVQNVAFLDAQYPVASLSDTESPPPALKALHQVARLCNGAKFDAATEHLPLEERTIKGDATDSAVLSFSEALRIPSLGLDAPSLLTSHEKLFEIPFNSRNKWMLAVWRTLPDPSTQAADSTWMLVKGAPDVLFPTCTSVMRADGTVQHLDAGARRQLHALQEEWSSEGQRVLALCRRSLDGVKFHADMPANDMEELMYAELQGLTLVGFVGIRDPPRPDVPGAVATIRRAGVRVFMVTGDFKLTALAIAKQVRSRYVSRHSE